MAEALLAIIPARDGSKRIPHKNVAPFFGHPMLAYAIAAARHSDLFQRIVVSTDSAAIGKIAQWYGAEWLPRPAELASDSADLVDVCLHALDTLAAQGFHPRAVCQLMPNCPLRTSQDIRDHGALFLEGGRKFQISVVPYRGVYPHWALVEDEGRGRLLFGSQYLVASQKLQRAYCPTGAIWWADCAEFRRQRSFYGDPHYLALMDANRGLDIDDAADLELAELLVRGLRDRDRAPALEAVDEKPFGAEALHA